MEKEFKAKGWNLWTQMGLFASLLLVGLIVWMENNPFLLIITLSPLLTFFYQRSMKYVVKENGDLWVKSLGSTQQRAIGIYRVVYNPQVRGWDWRRRQMVIYYKNGLKQGFFSILPVDSEGLIAVLEERNPGMEIQHFDMPVNK